MLPHKCPLLICLSALALPVLGNPVSQAELEKCAALGNDAEKLTCYEGLTEAGRTAVKGTSARPSGLLISVPDTRTRVETSSNETSVTSTPRPIVEEESKPAESKPPESSSPASDPGLANLGNSKNKRKEKAVYPATVSRVESGRFGHLIFYLDNGQVWRQAESRHFSVPKSTPFDVEISPAFLGGYRLKVDGRSERIRRIK